jgi:DNA helicase HerA-like ATPase
MGLVLISQRPSRVDSTILSQCNSFIILKIINPGDQKYVRDVVESIGEEDARILPDLATGEALITGECIRFPMLAKIEMPKSKGKHEEEDFIKGFITEIPKESKVGSLKSEELPLLKKQ